MRQDENRHPRVTTHVFDQLDYKALGAIYCDEGGEEFWKDRREPCQTLGVQMAKILRQRLKSEGRSLYVGAGVAEIPMLVMETLELHRKVAAFNLRAEEVTVLNAACKELPFQFSSGDASTARGTFDHLWIVSVLNDPERFPELSALSYGRANPVTFNPAAFTRERQTVTALTDACLTKLTLPALLITSVERNPLDYGLVRKKEDRLCHRRGGLPDGDRRRSDLLHQAE